MGTRRSIVTFVIVFSFIVVGVLGVVGASFWDNTENSESTPGASKFPGRTAERLQNVLEREFNNLQEQEFRFTKTPVNRKDVSWNMYEYHISLNNAKGISRLFQQLSHAIYASGGEIFQKHIQPDRHKAIVVIGIETFITHTLVFSWSASEAPALALPQEASSPQFFSAAIVIDDLGASTLAVFRLLDLGEDFTFSILPHQQHSHDIALMLHERQKEILLHLPMEAQNSHEFPGEGAMMLNMTLEDMRQTIERNLLSVPFAIGVNNHMGSLFSAHAEKMEPVLRQLDKHHLFFLDSRTSAQSVAYDVAQRLGVKSAVRKVFLDADPNLSRDTVSRRLRELATLAEQGMPAIAIGHPKEATFQGLEAMLPELKRRNIHIVRVSQFMQ